MTKDKIFRAALTLSRRHGVDRVIKKHIAEHLDCGMGTINYHYQTMAKLRQDVVDYAQSWGDTGLLTGRLRRK